MERLTEIGKKFELIITSLLKIFFGLYLYDITFRTLENFQKCQFSNNFPINLFLNLFMGLAAPLQYCKFSTAAMYWETFAEFAGLQKCSKSALPDDQLFCQSWGEVFLHLFLRAQPTFPPFCVYFFVIFHRTPPHYFFILMWCSSFSSNDRLCYLMTEKSTKMVRTQTEKLNVQYVMQPL